MTKKIVSIMLIFVSISVFSQRNVDKVIEMNSKIDDLIQNPITGIIVVKEG